MMRSLILIFGFILFWGATFAQDEELILAQREASNQALRNFDEELNNTFHTDDILITTGAGALISGKVELMQYIEKDCDAAIYLGE